MIDISVKMKKNKRYRALILLPLVFFGLSSFSLKDSPVYNGIPWFDDNGYIVNAHGACIVRDKGLYYLFGEWKSDISNAFPGFSCYSSKDLSHWKFERVVLPMQKTGLLGPGRVGERVKVMKCPSTGEYVMYMHADDLKYKDPYICYATSKTINGKYHFQGPLLFKGEPIKRWDMGTFQDTDGKGYLLIHHGQIYRLSEDYKSAEALVISSIQGSGESPAMFKKRGLYYLIYSSLTSWEKNDNYYYTSSSIEGPWMKQGLIAPKGKLTYNSQTTFIFPLVHGNDTIPMYMGDRWSYPHQASAATYVWLPMKTDGVRLYIPEYWNCWDVKSLQAINPLKGAMEINQDSFSFSKGKGWSKDRCQCASNIKGSTLTIPFYGSGVIIEGVTSQEGGYAEISISKGNGKMLYSSYLDFYSKNEDRGLRFISPTYPKGNYKLIIKVLGEHSVWTDKTKTRYGSSDYYVKISQIYKMP